jgi:hypothetical protein
VLNHTLGHNKTLKSKMKNKTNGLDSR